MKCSGVRQGDNQDGEGDERKDALLVAWGGGKRRMVLANVCTVLLYVCFLGACVMTSVESVKSVIRASTTPVSSTSIHFQQHKYNPPGRNKWSSFVTKTLPSPTPSPPAPPTYKKIYSPFRTPHQQLVFFYCRKGGYS